MKKELSILSLALVPVLGYAAGATLLDQPSVKTTDCSLLQDDLKIGLSSNVVGAYSCNDTATQPNIGLAACHTSGRTSSRSATTTTPAGCGIGTAPACSTTVTTATGAVVPTATTLGGSMQMNFPGKNCDAAGATVKSQVRVN